MDKDIRVNGKVMRAKFIGITSCGFISNHIYNIKSEIKNNYIYIYAIGEKGCCPYHNLESFLQNWKII